MTSTKRKQLKDCFMGMLFLSSEGRLSKNDLSCLADAVQDYLNCHISVLITDNGTDFSDACTLRDYTWYNRIDNAIILLRKQVSHLLATSEGVETSIRHHIGGEIMSIEGTIHFPIDKVSFVFVRHETLGWEVTPKYILTILIPESM